ncbi:MAG: hypothetical protein U9M90_03560 [Patescibacteria group bacterium]|nr:hypothetical protein [Patescibacteria group bacterium]
MVERSIRDQLIEQAEFLKDTKENSKDNSELVKMIKNTADNTEEEPETSNRALDVIFSGEKIDAYSEKGQGANETLQRYRQGIEQEIKEGGVCDSKSVKEAAERFFKKNPGKRNTKAGKIIIENLERSNAGTNQQECPTVETSQTEKNKEKKETITGAPKTVEEFESLGYKISDARNKFYYNNEEVGVDLEITGFDPKTEEVTIVHYEHSKIGDQEEGQNVITLGDKADKVKEEKMPFGDFAEKIKGYVEQGSQKNETIKEKEMMEKDDNGTEMLRGKLFRNKKGEKIKVLESGSFEKGGVRVKKGQVLIRTETPEETDEGERIVKKFRAIKIERLQKLLEENGYKEVNTSIRIGAKGTVWRKDKETFVVAKHYRGSKGKAHKIAVQFSDGKEEIMDLGDLKEKIDSERWTREEKPKKQKEKIKEEAESGEISKSEERREKVELDEGERETMDKIFSPYAQQYIEELDKFSWGEGYTPDQIAQLKKIEKEKFWGNVLPSRISEANFIRKEAIPAAVDLLKESAEKEAMSE